MDQAGEYAIAARREDVWTALNDPDVLGQCIDGCQEVTKVDEEHFDVKVKAKIGPVSAVFQAALELKNLVPPESYTIEGSVKGGAAGFGKGKADVTLSEEGETTVLRYSVNASVGGKLAQIGSRLVDGAMRKMADDFFAAFSERLAPATPAPATNEAGAETEPDPATQTAEVPEDSSGQWKMWAIAALVVAVAVALTL